MSLLMHLAAMLVGISTTLGMVVVPLSLVLFVAWPVLYFGLATGLWAATPGKKICKLSVIDTSDGCRITMRKALARETLKLLSIASLFGACFCLVQALTGRSTWYDQLCSTNVSAGLRTPLQEPKRFKKHLEEQYRRNP